MNLLSSFFPGPRFLPASALILAILAPLLIAADAPTAPASVDDFSDAKRTSNGAERVLADDKALGSQSKATQTCEAGVLAVVGELAPGRGVPAFISLVVPLSSDWKPHDATGYEGIRLRVKVTKGILSVQVASTEVENFDYHTGAPISGKGGASQEVRVPFKEMKRAWSEQTALNLKSITSVNLVAFGMARDDFSYEVDEIGFY